MIEFADNVSKERQNKGYCLISNESDFWKCALQARRFFGFFGVAGFLLKNEGADECMIDGNYVDLSR